MEFDDPRSKRMVMRGARHRGAELADITHSIGACRTAAGPWSSTLGPRADGLIPKLPVPKFIPVIAGSRCTADRLGTPLIPGDTMARGPLPVTRFGAVATDFAHLRALHSRIVEGQRLLLVQRQFPERRPSTRGR